MSLLDKRPNYQLGYKTIQSVSKKYIRYCRPSLLQYAILCRLMGGIDNSDDDSDNED